MNGMLVLALVVTGLALLGTLAILFGVDTTPVSDDQHHTVGLTL